MEKQSQDVNRPCPKRTLANMRKSKTSCLALTLVSCLFLWVQRSGSGTWFSLGGRPQASQDTRNPFDWDMVPTRPFLDYVDCYDDEYKCARLELPMDYWNGSTDATVSIAVIRKPAVVPITHPQYGGAVLHNPGGPGGSGVDFIRLSGSRIRGTIDSEDGKYFDLISFDPRGIMHSKPAVHCFADLRLDQVWQTRVMEEGVFSVSDAAFGRLWSMGIARGQSCALPVLDGVPDIRKYVSTAYAARDMLEIVERHGEWREKEVARFSIARNDCHGRNLAKLSQITVDSPETLMYQRGKEKINYWGFSYGTYLGNTFAAMFPDRINRMVVDGVVDADDYTKMLWYDNLVDTEKDVDLLYYHCARVGYPTCALANETGETTADGVKQRMRNITEHLHHNPLPVISANPEVVTLSDVKNLIFAGLYSPVQAFPFIANIMADIERGDGTKLATILRAYHRYTCPARSGSGFSIIPLRNKTDGENDHISYDAMMAIACSDGDDQSWMTKAKFEEYAKKIAILSPSIGEMWANVRMMVSELPTNLWSTSDLRRFPATRGNIKFIF